MKEKEKEKERERDRSKEREEEKESEMRKNKITQMSDRRKGSKIRKLTHTHLNNKIFIFIGCDHDFIHSGGCGAFVGHLSVFILLLVRTVPTVSKICLIQRGVFVDYDMIGLQYLSNLTEHGREWS